MVAIVGATALMILTGFTGQISLGHAAFLAIGAYTTGILGFHYGMPFWIGLQAGGVLAALCDGSVRFIGNTVHLDTWRWLGTAWGEEVLDMNF